MLHYGSYVKAKICQTEKAESEKIGLGWHAHTYVRGFLRRLLVVIVVVVDYQLGNSDPL